MPSKSPAQARLMGAIAHGWHPTRMKGPPRAVAKEFHEADKEAQVSQLVAAMTRHRKGKR